MTATDREASLEAYAEYFNSLSEEVGIAMQLLDALSAYTSPEHMLELRGTFAGALAAVDRAADRKAREDCAGMCRERAGGLHAGLPTEYTKGMKDGANLCADAIRETIR
jgi:hypothetical protein